MEIGKVTDKFINNTINETKNNAAAGDFETRLKSAMDSKNDSELKKVCKDFEGILLNMMYKQMKATVPKSELVAGDMGRDVFESMLDDKLVEQASKGKGLGLGDILYKQLSRQAKSTYKPSSGNENQDGNNE